jgi:ribonuclease E/ribonuclease G
MLIDTLLIEATPGEIRTAGLVQGRVWEVDHFRSNAPDCMGAVHFGRVRRIDPGMNAAFVELGGGWTRDGFLRARDAGPRDGPSRVQQIVQEGASVIVQISGGNPVRGPETDGNDTGKGPNVTTAVVMKSPSFDYLPTRRGVRMAGGALSKGFEAEIDKILQTGEGLRLEGPYDEDQENSFLATLAAEIGEVRRRWNELKAAAGKLDAPDCILPAPGPVARALSELAHPKLRRIVVGDARLLQAARDWVGSFMPVLANRIEQAPPGGSSFAEFEVDGVIEEALQPQISVAGGATLLIEPGHTLTAIDVNSAAQQGKAERGGVDTNLAVVSEIARQVRLRSLTGSIVIDFINMPRATDRDRVAEALTKAVSDDPAATHVLGISHLGLVEMTRARRKPSLAERLVQPVPEAKLLPETVAYQALREILVDGRGSSKLPLLRVAPEIADILAGGLAGAVKELETELGIALRFESDPDLARSTYQIDPA